MAAVGWDVGQVYANDVGILPADQVVGRAVAPLNPQAAQPLLTTDDGTPLSADAARRRFFEFLRHFRERRADDDFVYRTALQDALAAANSMQRVVTVDLADLRSYDPQLASALVSHPALLMPLFEIAAQEAAQVVDVAKGAAAAAAAATAVPSIQVTLRNPGAETDLRSIQSSQISSLVCVRGIVISATKTRSKATVLGLRCSTCGHVRSVPVNPGLGGAFIPRTCGAEQQLGGRACPMDPYVIDPQRSRFINQQVLKIQELPESVPTGEMPRHVVCVAERTLCDRVAPGTRVRVLGIQSIQNKAQGQRNNFGAVGIRHPYLRMLGMETAGGDSQLFDPEQEGRYLEIARIPDLPSRIARSIDPAIYGLDDIKRSIACLLFGGSRKQLPDGTRLRGDINVLLLGDPSAGKSQLLKYTQKIAPIGVYTSGKGSSAAGLTASVIRDPSGEFYLEGGSMVLADGGVACIDEFDKMREQDRVAIHEAMEQQTISIAKAGITTMLNSRTAVLAAANPSFGRYDDTRAATEQIDFQTTILSRFDLIFIVRDIREEAKDRSIAAHVLHIHQQISASRNTPAPELDPDELRRYISYARHKCEPRLSEEATVALRNEYVMMRDDVRTASAHSGAAAIPITVRQLEAIVRISESLAKMTLSPLATADHVSEAIRLFRASTLDAAKSGLVEVVGMNPEQTAEVEQVEERIRSRLAVNSSMPESALIEFLTTMGFNTSAIRRAITIMVQREELEYRAQRRKIFRKK